MNILLVDDDVCVMEALKHSLDFKALGIKNAYYAYGVEQAKKIMEDVEIHVLVSDIEMPKENGFVLLEWIRKKGFIVQEILLTMYAEFEYAKQAIQYDCYSYALKPLDVAELSEMIRGAIEKEKQELEHQSDAYYRNLWQSSVKNRKEHFFRDFLWETEVCDKELYGVSYKKEDKFCPVLVSNFEERIKAGKDSVRAMEEWEIKNLLRECLKKQEIRAEGIYFTGNGKYLLIFQVTEETDTMRKIGEALKLYFERIRKKKGYTSGAFIGKESELVQFKENIRQFEHFIKHHLLEPKEIKVIADYDAFHGEYQPADFRKWEKYISEQQIGLVQNRICAYFAEQKAANTMSPGNLRRMVTEFEQMLYSVLKSKGIVCYELDEPVFSEELSQKTRLNMTSAMSGMGQMLDICARFMAEENGEKSILDKVIEYIEDHLGQELTRENLAEMVFLNPDYLARIFKKKTGESIGNYILNRRIDMAKEYLEKTNEPVNIIAVKCGYDNFSYFTKVFKGKTELTPKEYRKCYSVTG